MESFEDRAEAGRFLASHLEQYSGRDDVIVLALPRGGVPVAVEVARALDVPLDVFVVRKLGVPGHEELAMGAIATGGVRVLNREVLATTQIDEQAIEAVAEREGRELERRERLYRGDRPPPEIAGRVGILVDDGLATGSSMMAAVGALRDHGPARTVVAVPVAPPSTCETLRREADEVLCPLTPEPFYSVGSWYEQFEQLTDEQTRELLREANGVGSP